MSYFAVVCGDITRLESGAGKLVSLADAQPYVASVVQQIVDQERGPFYLWDDCETGTSSELLYEAEDHFHKQETIVGTSLYALLTSAETCSCAVYVWWANKNANLRKLPRASTVDEAMTLIDAVMREQSSNKMDINMAFRPAAR